MDTCKNGDECRICLGGLEEGEMNTFCHCTNALSHAECVLKWIAASGRKSCEICKSPYHTRVGRLRPFWKWHVPTGTDRGNLSVRGLIFVVALMASICNISIFIHSTNVFFKQQALTKWQFIGRSVAVIVANSLAILGDRWWEIGIGLVFTVIPPVAVVIYTGMTLGPFMAAFCMANRSLVIIPKGPDTSSIVTISNEFIEMASLDSSWRQDENMLGQNVLRQTVL